MEKQKGQHYWLIKGASYASVGVAGIGIVLKAMTFFTTGSMAILSTLFDSVQDFLTSAINFFAVHHALKPADHHHRFGHGKAQAIGALIQSVIIIASALFLIAQSVQRLVYPRPLTQLGFGLEVLGIIILLTIALVRFQSYVIRKTGALSIKADQAHYTGDVLMNVGVIVSMLIAYYFQFYIIDALFGIGVGLYLFFVVFSVLKESVGMLMDSEMPLSFRRELEGIVLTHKGVYAMHDLKTRTSGDNVFVQFAIDVDGRMTLKRAHDITDSLEAQIHQRFSTVQAIIHPEPYQQNDR